MLGLPLLLPCHQWCEAVTVAAGQDGGLEGETESDFALFNFGLGEIWKLGPQSFLFR